MSQEAPLSPDLRTMAGDPLRYLYVHHWIGGGLAVVTIKSVVEALACHGYEVVPVEPQKSSLR